MRLHVLTHVAFEGPANIEAWAFAHQYPVTQTALWNNEPLPVPEDLDFLIVMGGPMNIYEENIFPWLKSEKKLIEQCIKRGKKILGVCLGAQLIADVLGGKVYKNAQKEIGWLPIELTEAGKKAGLFSGLSASKTVFHWHGDTFYLPSGAVHLARSKACEQQAFIYDSRVAGLQFHIESTAVSVKLLTEYCKDELVIGPFIQSEKEILSNQKHYSEIQKTLNGFLNCMAGHEESVRAAQAKNS